MYRRNAERCKDRPAAHRRLKATCNLLCRCIIRLEVRPRGVCPMGVPEHTHVKAVTPSLTVGTLESSFKKKKKKEAFMYKAYTETVVAVFAGLLLFDLTISSRVDLRSIIYPQSLDLRSIIYP